MLKLPCPWCGERNETEFACGGPKRARRPVDAAQMSDEAWIAYLTAPASLKGPLLEKWHHVRGCGRWFTLTRDTFTHTVSPVNDR